jgi:hypothetical protein
MALANWRSVWATMTGLAARLLSFRVCASSVVPGAPLRVSVSILAIAPVLRLTAWPGAGRGKAGRVGWAPSGSGTWRAPCESPPPPRLRGPSLPGPCKSHREAQGPRPPPSKLTGRAEFGGGDAVVIGGGDVEGSDVVGRVQGPRLHARRVRRPARRAARDDRPRQRGAVGRGLEDDEAAAAGGDLRPVHGGAGVGREEEGLGGLEGQAEAVLDLGGGEGAGEQGGGRGARSDLGQKARGARRAAAATAPFTAPCYCRPGPARRPLPPPSQHQTPPTAGLPATRSR